VIVVAVAAVAVTVAITPQRPIEKKGKQKRMESDKIQNH
jgi:hypothetical protein